MKTMSKSFFFMIILINSILSCATKKNIKYVLDDQGLFVEKFNSQNKDINRYNKNNKIYKVDYKFTFNFYYKSGNRKHLEYDEKSKGISLPTGNNTNYKNVKEIILTVNPGLGPFGNIPNYNQTVYTYDYKFPNGELGTNEMTGLIENEKNIWIHPPRNDFFKILELNPYPYVKFPLKVGEKWNWELNFGDQWSDKRWLEWSGKNTNKIKYSITKQVIIKTELGDLKCYVIESKGTSMLGETKLISYFNKKYGFVKLEYYNIDGSQIILSLTKREEIFK